MSSSLFLFMPDELLVRNPKVEYKFTSNQVNTNISIFDSELYYFIKNCSDYGLGLPLQYIRFREINPTLRTYRYEFLTIDGRSWKTDLLIDGILQRDDPPITFNIGLPGFKYSEIQNQWSICQTGIRLINRLQLNRIDITWL